MIFCVFLKDYLFITLIVVSKRILLAKDVLTRIKHVNDSGSFNYFFENRRTMMNNIVQCVSREYDFYVCLNCRLFIVVRVSRSAMLQCVFLYIGMVVYWQIFTHFTDFWSFYWFFGHFTDFLLIWLIFTDFTDFIYQIKPSPCSLPC